MIKKKKNILILGGGGFFGANFTRRLLSEPNLDITIVDSFDPLLKSDERNLDAVKDKITLIKGDIRDENLLKKIIPGKDIIFNLAGQTSHPVSLQNPALDADINVSGALKVLLAVRDLNPGAVLVYASTSTIMGKAKKDFIDEDHPENHLDIYSAHKGIAEKYHRIFANVYGLKTVSLRFANLYGPYGKGDAAFGFFNYFIHLAKNNKPITVYEDGNQLRNAMFVDDACDILRLAAEKPELYGGAYFAVHGDHHSVREIAENIAGVFGSKVEFIPYPKERKNIEVDHQRISGKRLYELTGWHPKYSLREGLKITKERSILS